MTSESTASKSTIANPMAPKAIDARGCWDEEEYRDHDNPTISRRDGAGHRTNVGSRRDHA